MDHAGFDHLTRMVASSRDAIPPAKHDVASSAIRLPGQVPLHLNNRHAHRIVVRRVRPKVAMHPLVNRRAQCRRVFGKRDRYGIGQPLLQVEGWGAHARVKRGSLWRLRLRRCIVRAARTGRRTSWATRLCARRAGASAVDADVAANAGRSIRLRLARALGARLARATGRRAPNFALLVFLGIRSPHGKSGQAGQGVEPI